MYHQFCLICLLVLLSVISLGGCKRLPERPSGMPDTTPCTLTVMFGGEKLDEVGVFLKPKDLSKPWSAGGKTDKNGKVVLKTGGYYTGVVPGEYTISFQKNGLAELDQQGMPIHTPSLIPLKYTARQSKETITVTKEQSNYVFELEGLPDSQK
jgi:hypothetical protein